MNDETVMLTDPETEPSSEKQSDKSIQSFYEWVEAAVFSLTFVVLVFAFLFRIVGVDGESMMQTLHNHDRLIVSRMYYTPQRGDIVIVNRINEMPLVKRVIAVGGDRLQINPETNEVMVNGVVQQEPYIQGLTYPGGFGESEQEVPEGHVFVMGDNRENSKDSRYMNIIGFVKNDDIMGKAIYRFLPINQAGGLY